MPKHDLSGACPKCLEIIGKYPNFLTPLQLWFWNLQLRHPEAHVSCAGRGMADQRAALASGASRADWTESSHNWNAALDVFELGGDPKNIYERAWYDSVLRPALAPEIEWYGAPGAAFRELPHVQWRGWRRLAKSGLLVLVENAPV